MNRPAHAQKKNNREIAHYRWKHRQKIDPANVPRTRVEIVAKSKYTPKS